MASRRGFTLIEVVGAVAAFVIAFLAGSSAFASLLKQQNTNFHRTLGSAAAMLLTDWHVHANNLASFPSNTVGADKPLTAITLGSQTVFKGVDYVSGDAVYGFNPKANIIAPTDFIDLSLYGSLIVTVSSAAFAEPICPPASTLTWRQVTLWYGSRSAQTDNRPNSLEFVGRYLVPDVVTP